jgi:hypothetical protein
MHSQNSLVFWIIAVVIFVGVLLGFAHGAQLTDTEPLNGRLWMGGALAVAALGVYLSYKLRK